MGGRGDNDIIDGGAKDDRIRGGPGTADVADFSDAPKGVEVNLPAEIARGQGEDEIAGIEDVTGSAFDDAIYGDDRPNSLFGSAGGDTLLGNQGPDFLQPDEGDDTVNGGGEADVVDYFFTEVAGPLAIDLSAGTAAGQGADTLISVEAAGGGRSTTSWPATTSPTDCSDSTATTRCSAVPARPTCCRGAPVTT